MATLATFRTDIRIDLDAVGDTTNFSNALIDRAVQRAVRDLSRYIPNEKVLDLLIDTSISDDSFTSSQGNAVALDNKFIKPESEVVHTAVSKGGTKYTRDTDYTMDYANGTITDLAAGSMADSTTHYVSYTVDEITAPLSSLSSDLLKVHKVEYNPINLPQQFYTFAVWGDTLFIRGRRDSEQPQLLDGKHLWIYYYVQHTAPTASANGTYPQELDEVVVKGALGYLMRAKASSFALDGKGHHSSAAVQLAAAHTAMENIRTIIDSANAHFTNMDTNVDSSVTELAAILGDLKGTTGTGDPLYETDLGNTASDLATTTLAEINTFLTTSSADALAQLTDIQNLASGPLKDADTEHDAAVTEHTAAVADMVLAETDLASATDVFAAQDDFIVTGSVPNAEQYLIDGDGTISTINDGENEAELYNRYAATTLGIADQYADNRKDLINQAAVHVRLAESRIANANSKIANANSRMQVATSKAEIADRYLAIAQKILNEAQLHIQTSNSHNALASTTIRILENRIQVVSGYQAAASQFGQQGTLELQQAAAYLNEAQGRISNSDGYVRLAESTTLLGIDYRNQADSLREEFFVTLRSRSLFDHKPFDAPSD